MSRIQSRRGARYGAFTLYVPSRGAGRGRVWPFLMILALVILPAYLRSRPDDLAAVTTPASATPRDEATPHGLTAETPSQDVPTREASVSVPSPAAPSVAATTTSIPETHATATASPSREIAASVETKSATPATRKIKTASPALTASKRKTSEPSTAANRERPHGEPAVPRSESSASLVHAKRHPHGHKALASHTRHRPQRAKKSRDLRAAKLDPAPAASEPKTTHAPSKRGKSAPPPM